MRPPEMTDEVKRDLEVLQMRNVLDPKRFYKHNDRKTLPKYFQVWTDNRINFPVFQYASYRLNLGYNSS